MFKNRNIFEKIFLRLLSPLFARDYKVQVLLAGQIHSFIAQMQWYLCSYFGTDARKYKRSTDTIAEAGLGMEEF